MFLFSVFVALGAALSFALAAVLQQEAARSADPDASLSVRLLLILLRRPRWLAGVGLLLCGYGLQALALSAEEADHHAGHSPRCVSGLARKT